jgi:hypothetical protein
MPFALAHMHEARRNVRPGASRAIAAVQSRASARQRGELPAITRFSAVQPGTSPALDPLRLPILPFREKFSHFSI